MQNSETSDILGSNAVNSNRINGRADPPAGAELQHFLEYARQVEGEQSLSLRAWLDLAETWRITRALRDSRGNRSAAARALGIGRRTLYAKMEKLGITPSWTVTDRDG